MRRYPDHVGAGPAVHRQNGMGRQLNGNVGCKGTKMLFKKVRNAVAKPAGVLGGALLAGAALMAAQPAQAQSAYPSTGAGRDDQRIAQGFAVSPVPLNLRGKDPAQVGLGSYWVNAAGDCDGCHSTNQFTTSPYNLPYVS
jgi:hypothetical protein